MSDLTRCFHRMREIKTLIFRRRKSWLSDDLFMMVQKGEVSMRFQHPTGTIHPWEHSPVGEAPLTETPPC